MQTRRCAGLRSFPRSLLQNEFIQRQIGNRLAQPAVLELKVLDIDLPQLRDDLFMPP
jgi:hypothetical protein